MCESQPEVEAGADNTSMPTDPRWIEAWKSPPPEDEWFIGLEVFVEKVDGEEKLWYRFWHGYHGSKAAPHVSYWMLLSDFMDEPRATKPLVTAEARSRFKPLELLNVQSVPVDL